MFHLGLLLEDLNQDLRMVHLVKVNLVVKLLILLMRLFVVHPTHKLLPRLSICLILKRGHHRAGFGDRVRMLLHRMHTRVVVIDTTRHLAVCQSKLRHGTYSQQTNYE